MTTPRLTIGIPHLDRTTHLQYAIDSCLQQRIPVHVLVADQGHTEETAFLMEQYAGNENVEHLLTTATCLWENWHQAALGCDTEFFAWLQDDDTLSRAFSKCVLKGFDTYPDAIHWQGSTYCSPDRIHAVKWSWTGPAVGLNMKDLQPEVWHGEFLVASMYFLCWALAPAWAFRCGTHFLDALSGIPSHCDLFTERLVPAEMGSRGDVVLDPLTAGYWHHHGGNESYKQNKDGSALQQTKTFVKHLDDIMDRTAQWQVGFYQWLGNRSGVDVLTFMDAAGNDENHPLNFSRHKAAIDNVMEENIKARGAVLREVAEQMQLCAIPGNGQATAHEELVWH